ncbi:hypothetical protein CEXT_82591 [Caerostris extrusa]|uniref:Uncharacterized protein n=1 Tax=Caerostris extrusa TaxID=172846 RepID=A0AAV4M2I6_CAEEX|nr:hypothetical protein CEXT_82591 [Caerostris extrusa]
MSCGQQWAPGKLKLHPGPHNTACQNWASGVVQTFTNIATLKRNICGLRILLDSTAEIDFVKGKPPENPHESHIIGHSAKSMKENIDWEKGMI